MKICYNIIYNCGKLRCQERIRVSNQDISLTLQERDIVGKGLNKLKNDGQIPAVIHNPGSESVVVSGNYLEMVRAYNSAGKHNPINVKVGDKDYLTMIKEVDFEPKKNQLRHVVFGAIKKDQKVKAEVQIEIVHGDEQIPAERDGLLVIKVVDSLEVEAIPSKLVERLTVDGSKLAEVGDKLHVSDIDVPEGVEILDEPDKTIVTVDAPRAAIEEAAEEEAEGEESAEENTEEAAEGEKPSEGEADKKPDSDA